MITDKSSDVLAFPREFPKLGLNHSNRPTKVSKKICQWTSLKQRCRFAKNAEYIFFAQYYIEVKQLRENIPIALRKGSNEENRTTGKLQNPENIKIYWDKIMGLPFYGHLGEGILTGAKTLHELFAMVRQLDIPTFFLRFFVGLLIVQIT